MSRSKFIAAFAVAVIGIVQPATIVQAQGPQIGIKVHGHWVIDIRNPDGTLASHLDFENALTSTGAQALADVLSGRATMSEWAVVFDGGTSIGPNTTSGPCFQSGFVGSSSKCTLVDPSFASSVGIPPGPGVGSLTTGETGPAVNLSGTVTAISDGTIGVVATLLRSCQGSNCLFAVFSSANPTVSATDSSSPTVRANQVVFINVTLSFS